MRSPNLAESVSRIRTSSEGPDGPLLAAFATHRDETAFLALRDWAYLGRCRATVVARGTCWSLGLSEAKTDTAMWELSGRPEQAVALFREKLKPVAEADRAIVEELVKKLDSPVFAERKAAGRKLTELGDTAVPQLRKVLAGGGSAEQRGRIERILAAADARLLPAGERLRQVRAVMVLERIGTADARRLLQEWASGVPSARLTREAKAALARGRDS